jgi:microtubule-associated protein-like 6
MGQTLGRAPLPEGCQRFLNLPRSCIYELWESFNDIAEGFGLTIEEFQDICKAALMSHLKCTERALNVDIDRVFRLFDDDENSLVDSLEFLSSFALLSGMTPDEKIRYIFALYDFDESQVLTLDEMVLAFRSTLSGLSKITRIDPPTEAEVEAIVVQGFETVKEAMAQGKDGAVVDPDPEADYQGIERDQFLDYCLNTPEITCWIEFFDDLEEYEESMQSLEPTPIRAHDHLTRDAHDFLMMNPTLGSVRYLDIEHKGPAKDFMPRKQFDNVVPIVTPLRLPDQLREFPPHNFTLNWAYGYNGFYSRQSLSYSAKGELVYATGAVVVIHNVALREQNFFVQHTDNVLCVKVYHTKEGSTIVASGEVGVVPAVHVWDCSTQVLLSTLKGFHRGAVQQLDFSPNREFLVTLGKDLYYSIAVYDWVKSRKVWSSRSTFVDVYDLRFLTDQLVVSCGKNHVYFWHQTVADGSFKRTRGLYGTAVKMESIHTVALVGNTIVTGGETGMLYTWEGRNLVTTVRGHSAIVNAMFVINYEDGQKGLVTGCTQGKVQVWTENLEIGATFNAATLGPVEPSIVSVCWDMFTSKILIGFSSAEIYEMDSADGRNLHGGSIVAAHSHARVCGLSPHPMNPHIFASVGDDRSVRIWDSKTHSQIRMAILDSKAHTCAYSVDAQALLIGMGSGLHGREERKEGAFVVLNEEDLTIVHEARDSKHLITDSKYAPDGSMIALSSTDGAIYIYSTRDYSARSKCRGHSGKVEHIDFSADGQFIQSNCSNGELLFWDVERGEQQVPKLVRDTQWETNTCKYSFATQGCWGPYADNLEINAVARTNAKDVIVTGDSFGRLRVYNSPVNTEDPNFYVLKGHGRDVKNVKFNCDDTVMYTSGGSDGCILQWSVEFPETQDYGDMAKDEEPNAQMLVEAAFDGKLIEYTENKENVLVENSLAVCRMEEGETETGGLLPWQRTIVAPSRVPLEDNAEPPDTLELEFVVGLAIDRSRQTVAYSPSGELAFFTAGVCVQMHQKTRKQRFYQEHYATITAMTIHPKDKIIATAQQSEVPQVRVWRSDTLETLSVLEGFLRRGVSQLAFSPSGRHLACVGLDKFHRIAIYDWRNQQIVSYSNSFTAKSLWLSYDPAGTSLCHAGDGIVRFWESNGLNLICKDALFGGRAKMQRFMCVGWLGNNAVVGTADGSLYRFVGRQLDGVVLAHQGCVNCIASAGEGVATGSTDGFVKIWTRILECRLVIEMKELHSVSPNVRGIAWDGDGARMFIATSSCEVYEVNTDDGQPMHDSPLLEGHSGEELYGLAVNPIKDVFATVGDDAILRVWDTFEHTVLNTVSLEMAARCCCYHPEGRRLMVGFGCPKKLSNAQYDGKWVVLDCEDYQVMHEARDSQKWLTCAKFSPSGEFLAVGSMDCKLYVYNVLTGYGLSAIVSQHNAPICHVDFSEDSAWIMSNCSGMELFFFEADTGMFIPAASRLRDIVWASQNCTMAWAVQGIWPPQKDGTDISACDCNLFRGTDGTIAAVADNYGRISLLRYPVQSSFAVSKKYRASSNPIRRLNFASGDSYVISISGEDKTVFQWAHRRDRGEDVSFDVLERGSTVEEDEDDIMTPFGLSGAVEEALPDMNEVNQVVVSRPWVAAMIAPSEMPRIRDESPLVRLETYHIMGYQSQMTRQSVKFNAAADVIYPASRFVCVYDKKQNSQIYYTNHTSEISCVGVSSDGRFAGSADRSSRALVHVWDAVTCEQIIVLPVLHRRGVISISFSHDNRRMVSVGEDQDNSIGVWESPSGEWYDGRLLGASKAHITPCLFAAFTRGTSDYILASGGRFFMKFWTVDGRCLNASYAEYPKKHNLGTLLCGAAVTNNLFVTGSSNGHLFVWKGRTLLKMMRAHEQGVSALWGGAVGVVSASKDGMIKHWNHKVEHIKSLSLSDADVPPLSPVVRSCDAALTIKADEPNRALVATSSGEIYEVALKSGGICLMQESHFKGELWGLGMHPTDPDLFATSGDDRTIRIWSVSHKRIIRKAVLDCTARCVSWSSDGRQLIVGFGGTWDGKRQRKDGAFIILDSKSMKPMFEGRDSRHWIQDVKFSPDGRLFAVGSMDHKIYIYNRETFRMKGTCDRHNSFIKTFDFSSDGIYIQSDSGDHEHLYFEAEDGQYFASGSQLKDMQWSDWTCSYGWPVQGAWPRYDEVNDGSSGDPTAMHRSKDEKLLAVGDAVGNVKAFHWPCINKDAHDVRLNTHVGEVAKVRFTCDNKFVVSLGKKDRTIQIHKILPEKYNPTEGGALAPSEIKELAL